MVLAWASRSYQPTGHPPATLSFSRSWHVSRLAQRFVSLAGRSRLANIVFASSSVRCSFLSASSSHVGDWKCSVNAYDAPNARLVLVHTFPFHRRPRDLGAAANVVDGTLIDPKLAGRSAVSCREVKLDVSLILPPASAKELYEVGAWVSVIGYVAYPGRNSRSTGSKDNTRGYRSAIEVQALVLGPSGGLGSSGGVQDERYMRGLEAKRKGMRILDKARRSFKTEKEA